MWGQGGHVLGGRGRHEHMSSGSPPRRSSQPRSGNPPRGSSLFRSSSSPRGSRSPRSSSRNEVAAQPEVAAPPAVAARQEEAARPGVAARLEVAARPEVAAREGEGGSSSTGSGVHGGVVGVEPINEGGPMRLRGSQQIEAQGVHQYFRNHVHLQTHPSVSDPIPSPSREPPPT